MQPPPAVGQRLPSPLPQGRQQSIPSPSASPAPELKRDEFRLPLPPPKKETAPIQVADPPVDPNAIDENGTTPLMDAAGKGDLVLMKELYDLGAEVNQTDRMEHTALDYAIFAKSRPAVEWLIAHGAEVTGDCCGGTQTSLAHALHTGLLDVIEPVLRAERPEQWGRPALEALQGALGRADKPFIRLLLENHATAPLTADSRQPLLAHAVVTGDQAMFSLLLECGADPNTPLTAPVKKDFSRLVSDAGIRDYVETERGLTPLMLAAGMGRLEYVQTLLQYGAKRGARTARYKMTAIDFAARRCGSAEMLQVLLGKSPRPEDQRMWVEISIGNQRAILYKDGRVAMVTAVSTGMPGFPTPTGRFVVTDKTRLRVSTIYHAEMPYFMRMSCRDFGMHAGVVPGYPASHGCIRLPYENAVRLYREMDVGTLVTISR